MMIVRNCVAASGASAAGDVRRLQPMHLRRPLNPEQRNCEQQAQAKGLHGEGCERGPSATGRLVPGAFECAEHKCSSGTGPVIRTDTCGLRFDPELLRSEKAATTKKTASARGLNEKVGTETTRAVSLLFRRSGCRRLGRGAAGLVAGAVAGFTGFCAVLPAGGRRLRRIAAL